MRRTQIGGYCLFKTTFSEEGRAWAAIPAARANRPGFGALGRAEARRPGGRRPRNVRPRQAALRRPPPINDARFPTPPPLPESANNGPAPQTTGLSRPGRPGLSVGQGTATRAAPLGAQSRSLPLTYCAYGATRTRIHSKTGDRRGLLLDATLPPLLHPASGHSHSWLNQLKKEKEHRHQARTPSIETYL